MNRRRRACRAEAVLKIVPRATHLFEEPGALAQVADFAAAWFWHTLQSRKPDSKPAALAAGLGAR